MIENLLVIQKDAVSEIAKTESTNSLQELRVKYLGKKGVLTQILRNMKNMTPEERPIFGQKANEVRQVIEKEIAAKEGLLKEQELKKSLRAEKIDITLPGYRFKSGKRHPITMVIDQMKAIFIGMGYKVEEGPEIETDYYNFEALNIPPDHPARDMQDSFYINAEVLLRTHTSPVQARTMEKVVPEVPVKIICPGKVYRRDYDATHSPMFHQVEGLVIDEKISMGDLKGTLLTFAREMFGQEREIRLRPSYFPFTEPSAEVDISCVICGGKGCRVCSHTGWLEILGAGMVHPNVLRNSGYDPDKVNGFAFGIGIERVAMLKYGIDDLRLLFENDIRFTTQF